MINDQRATSASRGCRRLGWFAGRRREEHDRKNKMSNKVKRKLSYEQGL